MTVLFVSDVHLSERRPQTVASFLQFLRRDAAQAEKLYILGDLFDAWLGDDDIRPPHPQVKGALAELTGRGVAVDVVQGNHDFLLGATFCQETGCSLLDDTTVIDLHGRRALILHGDTLCTADVEYQAFRKHTRAPDTQRDFLALPLADRAKQAAELKAQSKQAMQLKPDDIMDVEQSAVGAAFQEHGVDLMIHGHTHRPAVHELPDVAGKPCTRIVLGDWYEQDSALGWNAGHFKLGSLADVAAFASSQGR